jgi:hypothetical protein
MRRKKRRQRVRIGTAITMGQRRAHMAGLIGITSVKEMTAVSMHRWRALLVFVLLAFIIRGATFLLGSHDWDESLYVLGAESLLRGHLPYTQVWDHKPPGIFILFAAPIAVLREPVFAVRLLACVAVGVSSFCLWALLSSNPRQGSNLAGPVAGTLYMLFSLGNGGGTANTEIFYLALLLLALLTITGAARASGDPWTDKSDWKRIIAAGMLLGIAASINYLALLYGVTLAAVLIFTPVGPSETNSARAAVFARRALRAAFLVPGPLLVYSCIIAVYAMSSELDTFFYANVAANRLYVAAQPYDIKALAQAFGEQLAGEWFLWGCALLCPVVIRTGPSPSLPERRALVIAVSWLIVAVGAVSTSRLYWSHYFLQLNPALCLLAGVVIGRLLQPVLQQSRVLAVCAVALLMLGATYNLLRDTLRTAAVVLAHRYLQGQGQWGDVAAQVSDYIRTRMTPGGFVYVVDYSPIIYSRTGAQLPTRFVFPPFLIGTDSSRLIDTNPRAELLRILEHRPQYIVKKHERPDPQGTDDEFYSELDAALRRDYTLEKALAEVDLYRRTAGTSQ